MVTLGNSHTNHSPQRLKIGYMHKRKKTMNTFCMILFISICKAILKRTPTHRNDPSLRNCWHYTSLTSNSEANFLKWSSIHSSYQHSVLQLNFLQMD